MSGRYTRLANPSSNVHDPDRELEDAFELDDEQEEDTPLVQTHSPATANEIHQPRATHARIPSSGPPAYDFERQDYDFPPPGSPPPPSDRALPNNFGNSNGQLPESPVYPRPSGSGSQSLLRRTFGALFPSKYQRVPNGDASGSGNGGVVIGGGTENDGVFANVSAKPQAARTERAEDGSMYVVPEDTQKELPPTYAEAQADSVPPYWETTIHAPASFNPNDPNADMIIDDLPTGSFIVFALNLIFSFFFQFVGFFLSYLLHTTHAAKFGSRAGLGLTLIQYGFYSRMALEEEENQNADHGQGYATGWPGFASNATATMQGENPANDPQISASSRDWLSFLFMTIGWFLLLSSCVGFWRVKRWEASLRTPPQPVTEENAERDQAIRVNLAAIFGLPLGHQQTNQPMDPQTAAAEARLQRDLQAAGLL
ncbi:metal homeostatis protein bsd2 [Coprinopsis sp. MPI-PUGE-AT-0042]|nr:metal homeostatis protein bsd2 [Coprinopsis sp. MPI-PUGE-AT-0042]